MKKPILIIAALSLLTHMATLPVAAPIMWSDAKHAAAVRLKSMAIQLEGQDDIRVVTVADIDKVREKEKAMPPKQDVANSPDVIGTILAMESK